MHLILTLDSQAYKITNTEIFFSFFKSHLFNSLDYAYNFVPHFYIVYVMKHSFLLSLFLLLTGCAIGTSGEIKSAEKLLSQFECKNIESAQLAHSPITSYHERALAVSREKASSYIDSYKAGNVLFKIPLDNVVQQQYDVYKSACEALGGIQTDEPQIQIRE